MIPRLLPAAVRTTIHALYATTWKNRERTNILVILYWKNRERTNILVILYHHVMPGGAVGR